MWFSSRLCLQFIIVFFSLGAISSTAQVVWAPLIATCHPRWRRVGVEVWQCGLCTYSQLLGFAVATTIVVVWFVMRHEYVCNVCPWPLLPEHRCVTE